MVRIQTRQHFDVIPRGSKIGTGTPSNSLCAALKCIQAFDRLSPQFNPDSSVNYVYVGGVAMAMHMINAGANPRAIEDIDVFILNPEVQCPDRRTRIEGKTFQLFGGMMPFVDLKVTPKDIMIIEHNGIKAAVIRPEFLLVSKTGNTYGIRTKDSDDANWILTNLHLDQEYLYRITSRLPEKK